MKSQWFKYKEQAIFLRKKGKSLRQVEALLKVPRSTLSYWFQSVQLTKGQKEKLFINWKNALGKARKHAVVWHNAQKTARLDEARTQAERVLEKLPRENKEVIDLALAMLYLGEGHKTTPGTSLGSSDALILKFFIKALGQVYNVKVEEFKCHLHLRADQDPVLLKRFWSKELGIPLKNFNKASIDLRTKGKPTFKEYKGVCVLSCSRAAIQRKLLFLARLFSQRIMGG